ncbi:MAG: hypothetical protein L3J35_10910 [Bacteroidales bacterium]|nr:hypothetical protein [Bacteroidales bacterium]
MKQIKLLSILLIFVVFASSCKKTPHDKISGKWDVNKIENSTMTEAADIEFLNEMNAEVLENEIFEFSDKKISKKFPEATEGTWEMDEAGDTLKIDWGVDDMYSPHKFVIETLTEDSLVLIEDFDEFLITTSFIKTK